jgi:hypothetical protein
MSWGEGRAAHLTALLEKAAGNGLTLRGERQPLVPPCANACASRAHNQQQRCETSERARRPPPSLGRGKRPQHTSHGFRRRGQCCVSAPHAAFAPAVDDPAAAADGRGRVRVQRAPLRRGCSAAGGRRRTAPKRLLALARRGECIHGVPAAAKGGQQQAAAGQRERHEEAVAHAGSDWAGGARRGWGTSSHWADCVRIVSISKPGGAGCRALGVAEHPDAGPGWSKQGGGRRLARPRLATRVRPAASICERSRRVAPWPVRPSPCHANAPVHHVWRRRPPLPEQRRLRGKRHRQQPRRRPRRDADRD